MTLNAIERQIDAGNDQSPKVGVATEKITDDTISILSLTRTTVIDYKFLTSPRRKSKKKSWKIHYRGSGENFDAFLFLIYDF